MKFNLIMGIIFIVLGLFGIYFTITNFLLSSLALTIAQLALGGSQIELYLIKRDAFRGLGEVEK